MGISRKKRKSVIYDEKTFSGKNFFGHILGYFALYFSAKNQKKLMKQICTKSKKTQICPKKHFFENRAPSLFGHCHYAPLCQNSEKTNEPITRNRKMYPECQRSSFQRKHQPLRTNCSNFIAHVSIL